MKNILIGLLTSCALTLAGTLCQKKQKTSGALKMTRQELWHPGQFMAFDVIDGGFDEGGERSRIIARNAQFEADCFLINMMINEVCGKPKNSKEAK